MCSVQRSSSAAGATINCSNLLWQETPDSWPSPRQQVWPCPGLLAWRCASCTQIEAPHVLHGVLLGHQQRVQAVSLAPLQPEDRCQRVHLAAEHPHEGEAWDQLSYWHLYTLPMFSSKIVHPRTRPHAGRAPQALCQLLWASSLSPSTPDANPMNYALGGNSERERLQSPPCNTGITHVDEAWDSMSADFILHRQGL